MTFWLIYVLVLFINSLPPLLSGRSPVEAEPERKTTRGLAAERTERHLHMLAELAEIGMQLARDVARQALEVAEDAQKEDARGLTAKPAGSLDFGLIFARIARAVRQTVALEARLASEAEAGVQQQAASKAASERVHARQQKQRVRGLVEDAIAARAASGEGDSGEAENLRLDLDELLEDPDIEAELGRRPVGVIVAGICENLGIRADLSGFTDAELGFDMASMKPRAKPETEDAGPGQDAASPTAPDDPSRPSGRDLPKG